MQALIDFIVRNLLALWPIARVYQWQQGVRIRGGLIKEELSPGLHWRWWFMEEVYRVSATEQTLDLAVVAITTADGRSLAVSANIVYRIESVAQMWRSVTDIDKSMANIAVGFLATKCAVCTWEDLTVRRDTLQTQLASYMSENLRRWGVVVTRVHVTDLVEARQWRVFGDFVARKGAA